MFMFIHFAIVYFFQFLPIFNIQQFNESKQRRDLKLKEYTKHHQDMLGPEFLTYSSG